MFGLFLFWISQFKDVFTKRLFFIRIFRVLNTVQSFIFKVQFLYLACLSRNSSYIISSHSVFVKHFFILFWSFSTSLSPVFQQQLLYHIMLLPICQQVFYFFWSFVLISAPVFRGEDYNITPTNKRQALFSLFSDFHVFSVFHTHSYQLSKTYFIGMISRRNFPHFLVSLSK